MRADIVFAAFVGLTAAAPALFRRAATLPTLDPFYDPPSNVYDYTAGEIIRYRPTPGPVYTASNYTSNIESSYQIMFRTQSAIGNPTAAVTTVLIPYNAQYDKLLSYQTAYDSADVNCSPSYTLQLNANMTAYDPVLIAIALDQGWIVTTTDYEGLQAEFVAGLTEGYATLDAIRATLASGSITGTFSNATLGIWGYSGGALACEFALEVQPQYAPELQFVGGALGGLTPNVINVIKDTNDSPLNSLEFAGLNGLARAYPNMTDYFDEMLIPSKAALFHSVNFACTNETNSYSELAGLDIYSFFKNGDAALSEPVPASVIKWGATMGNRYTPRPPLYVYKAIADEVSPVGDTDNLVAKYCLNGARIQYSRNEFGEHVSEAILGSYEAVGYMIARMNRIPAPLGCSVSNVYVSPNNIDAWTGFTYSVIAGLKAQLSTQGNPSSIQGIQGVEGE